jgi:hypothetical protein
VYPDDVQFVPGHGSMPTFGQECQTNPYDADLKVKVVEA